MTELSRRGFVALTAAGMAGAPFVPGTHKATLPRTSNGIAVFSMGSLLSLAGQFVRFQTGGGIFVDISVVGSGLIALGFTAVVSPNGRSRMARRCCERLYRCRFN